MRLLITFLISSQMVLGSLPFSLGVSSVWAQSSCPTGQTWNENLGRCLSSEQSANVQAASSQCEAITTTEAKRQCYLAAAEGALNDAEGKGEVAGEGKVSANMMSVVLSMGGLGASALFLTTGAGCAATSAWIIAGSSVAAMMGELMSGMVYKKKMEEANKALKEINDGSAAKTASGGSSEVVNGTNVQEEAFKALIKKEEAVIAAAKVKKNLYMVATAGYAAAAVMAGIEVARMMMGDGSTVCRIASTGDRPSSMLEMYVDNYFIEGQRVPFTAYLKPNIENATNLESLLANVQQQHSLYQGAVSSLSLPAFEMTLKHTPLVAKKEFSAMKALTIVASQFMISPAQAQVTEFFAGLGSRAMGMIRSVAASTRTLFANPYTRLAFSGILTANSAFMMMHIGKEEKKANERKAFLEKLRQQVTVQGVAVNCGSADVNNQNPNCKDKNVIDQPQVLPGESTGTNGLTATGYGVSSTGKNTGSDYGTGCMTQTGSFDASCGCSKNNSCFSLSSRISGQVPNGISLGTLPSTIDKLSSGTLSATQVDSAAMGAAAARFNTMSKNLGKQNPKIAEAQKKALEDGKRFTSRLTASLAGNGGLAAASNAEAADLKATTPAEALAQMKEELKQEITSVNAGGVAPSSPAVGLNLNGLEDGVVEDPAAVTAAANVAQGAVEYDYGTNDINTESTSNIFDIVSERYKRSGIRRLFNSEHLIPADKASPQQINK